MLNATQDDLTIKLRADDGQFAEVTGRAAAGLDKITAAAKTTGPALAAVGQQSGLTRQQMMSLNYTVSDTVASLASGISPMTILLQQGPQLRDAFGGVGAAFRGVLSLLTPTVLGLGTLAGGVAAAAAAAYQGADDISQLNKTLLLSGNAAGLTADQYTSLSQRISEGSRLTIGQSRELVQALAATGTVSNRVFGDMAAAVAQVASITGEDSKKVAADFAKMSDGVAKWAAEHNKAWNFISVEQFKYVQRLEQQGRAEEASNYVSRLVTQRLEGQAQQLGYLDRALDKVTKTWSKFWDAVKGIGRPDTPGERLAGATQQLTALQAQLDRNVQLGRGEASIPGLGSLNDGLRQQIKSQQATVLAAMRAIDEANVSVANQSAVAAANRAGIASLMRDKPADKKEKPELVGPPIEAFKERLKLERDATLELFRNSIQDDDKRRREEAERQRVLDRAAQFSQQLVDQAAQIEAQLLPDREARGQALLAIERAQLTSRVQQFAVTEEQRKALMADVDAYMVTREVQLTEELKPEWQRRLEAWEDVNGLVRQSWDSAMNGLLDAGEGIWGEFLRTGKVNTKKLVDVMLQEFSRLTYRQTVAPLAAQGLGMLTNAVSGYFQLRQGDGFGTGNAFGNMDLGQFIGGGAATGSNYVERDMLTILHKGEAVIPKAYNPDGEGMQRLRAASAPPTVQNITYNVPPGMSPAAYAGVLEQNNRRLKGEVAADMVRPGRPLQRAAARSGRF